MELKRVVVTGLGAITPLGKSVPEYWDGLVKGVSGADIIQQFDIAKFKTRFACEVKDFEPTNYLERKEARKLDRFAQFALIASDEAVKDALAEDAADFDAFTLLRDEPVTTFDSFVSGLRRRGAL